MEKLSDVTGRMAESPDTPPVLAKALRVPDAKTTEFDGERPMNDAALDLDDTADTPNATRQDVVTHDHAPMAAGDMTPMLMLDRAIQSGASMETLEKLMALQERWEAHQARRAFDEAMADAKAEMPIIAKNRLVDFPAKDGKSRTTYRHEDLAGIAAIVDPILAKHGLSYRFRTSSPPNEPVTVTCIVSHKLGHSEENTLTAGRDDSGNKNSIQQVGSTITYLQRYTLKAALGLAAAVDDDALKADAKAAEPITDKQAADIYQRIDEANASTSDFLTHFKIARIEEMPARDYDKAVILLTKKKARQMEAAS